MTVQAADVDLTFGLSDRVAVITGGASGIGAAIAAAYVVKGASVAIFDLQAEAGGAATDGSEEAERLRVGS